MCWEVWGLEEAGRVLALMKVSSHQVLAVLAAVENPTNFTAGALPDWPVHTEPWVSGGAETVKQGILGEPRAGGTL